MVEGTIEYILPSQSLVREGLLSCFPEVYASMSVLWCRWPLLRELFGHAPLQINANHCGLQYEDQSFFTANTYPKLDVLCSTAETGLVYKVQFLSFLV